MVVCTANNCSNSSRIKNMRFFKFPNEEIRRNVWLKNSGLEKEPGPFAKLCEIHFEESQFELHRQDGWKKLKPNAVPTIFPEPVEKPRVKKEKTEKPRKRKRVSSEEPSSSPKKKTSPKENLKIRLKKCDSKFKTVHKRKNSSTDNSENSKQGSSDTSQNYQKENVSPKSRKSSRPYKSSIVLVSDSETEGYADSDDETLNEQEKIIESLKSENEQMKNEIQEFEKHNKVMARVILELEKHNKLMSIKLSELDKENKVMVKKISDLEKLNEDLKSKLNCCFSEEQIARMEKMRHLGTIERYIPALK